MSSMLAHKSKSYLVMVLFFICLIGGSLFVMGKNLSPGTALSETTLQPTFTNFDANTAVESTGHSPSSTSTSVDPVAVQQYLEAIKAEEWRVAGEYARAVTPAPTTVKVAPKQAVKQAQPKVTQAPASSGSAGNGFLECVKKRESGGNYSAVNPSSGAGGAYQFMPSTWAAMGGTGSPQNASPAQQDAMAAKLYATAGTSPWAGGQYSC